MGSLRPAIVLYDEPHPYGEAIGDLQAYDLLKKPDLLLIMGTSLKVHGLKLVVREFAKAVHAKKGLVVFINLTPPSKEWEEFIDIHIAGETDVWVKKVEEDWRHFRPGDWELQTRLEGEVIKEMPRVKAAKAKGAPKVKAVSTSTAQATKAKRGPSGKGKKAKGEGFATAYVLSNTQLRKLHPPHVHRNRHPEYWAARTHRPSSCSAAKKTTSLRLLPLLNSPPPVFPHQSPLLDLHRLSLHHHPRRVWPQCHLQNDVPMSPLHLSRLAIDRLRRNAPCTRVST